MTDEEISDFLSGLNEEETQHTTVVRKVRWPIFEDEAVKLKDRHNYDFIKEVKINLTAELGNTKIKAKEVLTWVKGSIIELNRLAGETVDLYINEQNLGKAEIIIINENFGIRIVSLNGKDQP